MSSIRKMFQAYYLLSIRWI